MGSGGGAWAQFMVADAGRVSRSRRHEFPERPTLPVALQTMHDAIVTHGQLSTAARS